MIIVIIGIFLSYSVPHIVCFLLSTADTYLNAPNEETYLSFEMVDFARKLPFYFSCNIAYLFHQLGIPGSSLNALFDLILVPVTVFLVYKIILSFGVPENRSILYSVIILFCSVLFDHTNPLIDYFYNDNWLKFLIVPGAQHNASILKTPEPQFSYFLISLAIFFRLKTEKEWVLFLPLPFLHFFVFVGYAFLLIVYLINKYILTQPVNKTGEHLFLNKTILSILVTYIVFSMLYLAAALLMYGDSVAMVKRYGYHYIETHRMVIPIQSLILVPLSILFITWMKRGYSIGREGLLAIALTVMTFALTNMQVINGFMLDHKSLHDYVITILSGVAMVAALEMCYKRSLVSDAYLDRVVMVLLIGIFLFVAKTNTILLGGQLFGERLTAQEIQKVRSDPLHAIITDRSISARIAYASPKMPYPPFSYQYCFAPYDHRLLENALKAAQLRYSPDSEQLKSLTEVYNLITSSRSKGLDYTPFAQSGIDYDVASYYFIEPEKAIEQYPAWVKTCLSYVTQLLHSLHVRL